MGSINSAVVVPAIVMERYESNNALKDHIVKITSYFNY